MPFIHTYNSAMSILSSINKGTCKGDCKTSWIRNIKYALTSSKNPLKLTKTQKKTLKEKIAHVSKRNPSMTQKKYVTRNSPPYKANQHCGKKMAGNDGQMYISVPNKNNICRWQRVKISNQFDILTNL